MDSYSLVSTALTLETAKKSSDPQAGLTALLKWHTAFLQYLWVHPDHRNRGYGSMLVAELEREARKHHCTNIAVHTFDFMALEFYQKLGFHICGQLPDAPRGHTYYWLRKPLI